LGLLVNVNDLQNMYEISELGKQLFQRASSFYVPHSYYEYMYKMYDKLLDPSFESTKKVDRLENVIGSGNTHLRYFPPALSFLKRKVHFDILVDIGCGDGHFLSAFLRNCPEKKVIGVDISQLAIDVTYKNLKKQYPNSDINMICSDALDIERWSNDIFRISKGQKSAISMWFLLHEISRNKYQNVIDYINNIHVVFPDSPIVICELVRHSEALLAQNRFTSIMPEYLFFHELSGQSILSWDEYQVILEKIPYKLILERLFDEIPNNEKELIPSSFIWCLIPE